MYQHVLRSTLYQANSDSLKIHETCKKLDHPLSALILSVGKFLPTEELEHIWYAVDIAINIGGSFMNKCDEYNTSFYPNKC